MVIEEENKITINKIIELIYKMYLKDLKYGNIVIEPIKSFGKICKKKDFKNEYKNPTLFKFGK